MYNYKLFYERRLPHIQPVDATLFVTFRLAGSIPKVILAQLHEDLRARQRLLDLISDQVLRQAKHYEEQRRSFGRYDAYLDGATNEPYWLSNPQIAQLLVDALHHRDGNVYDLHAFTIMSNHAHVVFKPLDRAVKGQPVTPWPLQTIMHSLKLYTARRGNGILGRTGQFWEHESYDHVVRSQEEWERIVKYVLNNPVKAGLCETWEDWPWSYCKF